MSGGAQTFRIIRVHLNADGVPIAACEPVGPSKVLGHAYCAVDRHLKPGDRLSLLPPARHADLWLIAP